MLIIENVCHSSIHQYKRAHSTCDISSIIDNIDGMSYIRQILVTVWYDIESVANQIVWEISLEGGEYSGNFFSNLWWEPYAVNKQTSPYVYWLHLYTKAYHVHIK